uniref:Dol-P-Man:Man(5)GlcNAc(2)-PP-Dol alpha-1,3-mannosyltransferase n=1 Tax=Panagrolaimus sp. JU765 TaxID=591449 RepID=A0AC34PW60_9BILA
MSKKHPKMVVPAERNKVPKSSTSDAPPATVRKGLESLFASVTEPGDTFIFRIFIAMLLFADVILSKILIDVIPYTEIDFSTYMQQVECFLNGERNYTRIEGDTGPVVYPAGHIWFYSLMHHLTEKGKLIVDGQHIFLIIYILNQLIVFETFRVSNRASPFTIVFMTCLSYRLHSIFMLRLFNDCVAMLFCNIAIYLMVIGGRRWKLYLAAIFYSLGVGVKMNVLLFAPAIALLVFIQHGFVTLMISGILAGTVQLILGFPFLTTYPIDYLTSAFNFGRVFLYKWTVNWKCVPEDLFLDRKFHLSLLALHLFVLLFFATFVWFRKYGGLFHLLFQSKNVQIAKQDILMILYSCNFIGVAFSRSLHYQFYSWYYHGIHFLILTGKTSIESSSKTLDLLGFILRPVFCFALECCWNTYPATDFSSKLLHFVHFVVLISLLFPAKQPKVKKS